MCLYRENVHPKKNIYPITLTISLAFTSYDFNARFSKKKTNDNKKNIHHSEIDLLNQKEYEYDEARMIQVFQNILGNAYKFTDESGMIQTKFIEKDGQLNISIFNTGKKIPEEDIELIFDKFYQSKNQIL